MQRVNEFAWLMSRVDWLVAIACLREESRLRREPRKSGKRLVKLRSVATRFRIQGSQRNLWRLFAPSRRACSVAAAASYFELTTIRNA